MKIVEMYTDGACKGNPGRGGWGTLLIYGKNEKELFGGEMDTTNNRMELTAVIKGLNALKQPCEVNLYLDSQYVKDGITKWLYNWKLKSWKTSNGKDVKNIDLWQKLDIAVNSSGHKINWHWVKGHAGNAGNERADELANKGVPINNL